MMVTKSFHDSIDDSNKHRYDTVDGVYTIGVTHHDGGRRILYNWSGASCEDGPVQYIVGIPHISIIILCIGG